MSIGWRGFSLTELTVPSTVSPDRYRRADDGDARTRRGDQPGRGTPASVDSPSSHRAHPTAHRIDGRSQA
jgi:hypothetical protein